MVRINWNSLLFFQLISSLVKMALQLLNSKMLYGIGGRKLHCSSVALLVTLILTAFKFEDLEAGGQNGIGQRACFLHGLIYTVVITQRMTGLLNLISDGAGIPFFNMVVIPALIDKQVELHKLCTSMYFVLSMVIYPLFAMHISAAIYHQLFAVLDDW